MYGAAEHGVAEYGAATYGAAEYGVAEYGVIHKALDPCRTCCTFKCNPTNVQEIAYSAMQGALFLKVRQTVELKIIAFLCPRTPRR